MNLHKKILDLIETNETFVVATVVESNGSAPGKSGFKLILNSKSQSFGTVGGGAIEFEVIKQCKRLLDNGENEYQKYLLSQKGNSVDNNVKVVPMMCNGKESIFYEVYRMKPEVHIFGGGHVGQALLRILPNIGFHIKLIDNREEFSNPNIAPGADEYICADYLEYTDSFNPPDNSFLISLTHGHSFDYEILYRIFSRKLDVKYVGVIASKSKGKQLKEKLLAEINSELDFSKLHTPIGLKIGGDSADEIALSIAAELQAIRYSKNIKIIA